MPMTLVGHPAWCNPNSCETAGYGDVLHRSAGISWQLAADDVEVTLRRRQIGAADGEATYEMTISHLAYPEESSMTLGEADIEAMSAGFAALRMLG